MTATTTSKKYTIHYNGNTIQLYDRKLNRDAVNCSITNIGRLFSFQLTLGQQKYLTNIMDDLGIHC